MQVFFEINDSILEVGALSLRQALGGVTEAELSLTLPEPLATQGLVGAPCAIFLRGLSERRVVGIVSRVATLGGESSSFRYEVSVRSTLHRLSLRRRSRVFQHVTVPEIVRQVVEESGVRALLGTRSAHAKREYCVQYAETDLAFVRRLCEEEGLFFRSAVDEDGEVILLEDTSADAPRAVAGTLPVGEPAGLQESSPHAWGLATRRTRAPGKVTLRAHDHEHPAVALEGVESSGPGHERALEVYAAPGRFKTAQEGASRARLALEAKRAEALTVTFSTNAVDLVPGEAVKLELEDGAERDVFVVALELRFAIDRELELRARAVPTATPFRLPCSTPRPRIAGVHPAVVTGAKGEEIHPDELGRVRVRFFWDREGPSDDGSSLPVRVLQPNLPGSMLIPRVGWEVMVAFEDGDPDRPFVVGRVYNAKQPPPFALPANKTITSLGTVSSPGGGRENRVHFDDAAGSQHLAWHAGFGKTTTVGADQKLQTKGAEAWKIGGTQSISVGANDTLAVKTALVTSTATQAITVGASQKVTIGGDLSVQSGTESISIGAALTEKVGNPQDGLDALSVSFALHEFSELPVVGHVASAAIGTAIAAKHAYDAGGAEAAGRAVNKGIIDFAVGEIPAGDSVVAAAEATGKMPWAPDPEAEDKHHRAPGGPSAATPGPAGAGVVAGAGHRIVKTGKMMEVIGVASVSVAPASIRWTTAGAHTLAIGGSHNVTGRKVHARVAGLQTDAAPALNIDAAFIGRGVKTSLSRTVGAASYSAGANFGLHCSGPLDINVSGALSLDGAKVTFICGSSVVSVSPGGLLVKATNVDFESAVDTSGEEAAP